MSLITGYSTYLSKWVPQVFMHVRLVLQYEIRLVLSRGLIMVKKLINVLYGNSLSYHNSNLSILLHGISLSHHGSNLSIILYGNSLSYHNSISSIILNGSSRSHHGWTLSIISNWSIVWLLVLCSWIMTTVYGYQITFNVNRPKCCLGSKKYQQKYLQRLVMSFEKLAI